MALCCLCLAAADISAFLSGNSLNAAASKSAKLRNVFSFFRSEFDSVRVTREKIRRRRRRGGGGFSGPHCAMEEVKTSSAWVASRSSHVFVDSSGIEGLGFPCVGDLYLLLIDGFGSMDGREMGSTGKPYISTCSCCNAEMKGLDKLVDKIHGSIPKVEWDFEGIHYFDNGPLTVQYLFVLDALNFCFWPDKDLNYDDLALGLKVALQNDKSAFDADRLQSYTGPQLRKLLNWPRPLPLEDERVRLLHEVGSELKKSFAGKASNLVEACGKSAVSLVALITRHFPGFRDHSLYKGHQVFLYKRAQIFASDLWGAFKGQGYGEFYDIGSITIFADYIVPAVLRELGVLRYSSDLAGTIDANAEISSGSEEEVEIRACTIYAVEKMKDLINAKFGKQVLSVELDLWLWSYGVQSPYLRHHRTLSIYY